MKKERRKFSAGFKAKVAIEAIKEQQTIHELAAKYEVHLTQINTWKREFLDNADSVFSKDKSVSKDDSQEKKELYSKIGELQIQVDFLKKGTMYNCKFFSIFLLSPFCLRRALAAQAG